MSHTNTTNLPECYRILNVSPSVNWTEVKKSYRSLALKFHPDHHPGIKGYENRFKEISSAFKTLEVHYQDFRRHEWEYSFDDNAEDALSGKTCAVDLETPSFSMVSVTNFASFLTKLDALPIAIECPHLRNINKSFIPSPIANIYSGSMR